MAQVTQDFVGAQGNYGANTPTSAPQAAQTSKAAAGPQAGTAPADAQHAQDAPPAKSRDEQLRAWMAHPLLLLIVGALVTGLLVPWVTTSWQQHQTAQDMKTQVVGDVTQSVSIPMAQLDVTQNPVFAGNNPQGSSSNIEQTYFNFLTKSASTGSEIAAYFPGNNIPTHWKNLVGLVHNFYLFSYATSAAARQKNLAGIKKYFDVHNVHTIGWASLLNAGPQSGGYRSAWVTVEHLVLDVRDQVTSEIMDAPTPSF